MKALLLNSGIGSRLGALTASSPKCMCPIGAGYTILKRQLELIRGAGIRDVVVTTGYLAEKLEAYARECEPGLNFTFVHNPVYRETNYIYSMHLAADALRNDDILLLHGDLVLQRGVIEDLLSAETSVMTVDRTLPLPEKDFKAKIIDGRIRAVGIHYFGDDCEACQAAYKWRAADFAAWMANIAAFCDAGNRKVYAEEAFNAVSESLPLYPLEMNGRLCSEIDNPEDLAAVSARFLELLKEEA